MRPDLATGPIGGVVELGLGWVEPNAVVGWNSMGAHAMAERFVASRVMVRSMASPTRSDRFSGSQVWLALRFSVLTRSSAAAAGTAQSPSINSARIGRIRYAAFESRVAYW